ncbi:Endonuclease/exonuclease/phosphatase [Artemisia annua]|uniref:Endonuclease/exonuclease/phosphatase n=1 Tax=Artemisia annua TaxID=35608 RepID=A0A2U1PW44_ARTAN|nr:Endonuclease/exonuclease/phosphatase [Artemisia annua]
MPRGGLEEEQHDILRSRIVHVILPNMSDRCTWTLEASSEFTVKSTRNLIDDMILPKVEVPTRWVKVIPINVNVHARRVCLDKLPSRLNLSIRGVDIPLILCPLCYSAVESTSHIFFSCPLARNRSGGFNSVTINLCYIKSFVDDQDEVKLASSFVVSLLSDASFMPTLRLFRMDYWPNSGNWLSNGIMINEPDLGYAVEGIRDRRFLMSANVTGKGKGKMDDVPASTGNGYHRMDGCVPRNSLADQSSGNVARFVLRRLLTFLQTANIGDAGVRSSGGFIANVNDGKCHMIIPAIAKSVGKTPVADLEIVGLANLKPSDIGKTVRVRVYRKWTLTSAKGARQPILSFILLDQQGGAIQANVEGRERNRFDNILEINDTYTITGFGKMTRKRRRTQQQEKTKQGE